MFLLFKYLYVWTGYAWNLITNKQNIGKLTWTCDRVKHRRIHEWKRAHTHIHSNTTYFWLFDWLILFFLFRFLICFALRFCFICFSLFSFSFLEHMIWSVTMNILALHIDFSFMYFLHFEGGGRYYFEFTRRTKKRPELIKLLMPSS